MKNRVIIISVFGLLVSQQVSVLASGFVFQKNGPYVSSLNIHTTEYYGACKATRTSTHDESVRLQVPSLVLEKGKYEALITNTSTGATKTEDWDEKKGFSDGMSIYKLGLAKGENQFSYVIRDKTGGAIAAQSSFAVNVNWTSSDNYDPGNWVPKVENKVDGSQTLYDQLVCPWGTSSEKRNERTLTKEQVEAAKVAPAPGYPGYPPAPSYPGYPPAPSYPSYPSTYPGYPPAQGYPVYPPYR